jgi:hypothetical protein
MNAKDYHATQDSRNGFAARFVQKSSQPEWHCTHSIQSIHNPQYQLLVEGALFRINAKVCLHPLASLLEAITKQGLGALADVTGDFVAIVVSRNDIYAFKSFTSQYQLYIDKAKRLVSNRLVDFVNLDASNASVAFDEDYFAQHTLIVPGIQFHGIATHSQEWNECYRESLFA